VARSLCPRREIMDTILVAADTGARLAVGGKHGRYRLRSLNATVANIKGATSVEIRSRRFTRLYPPPRSDPTCRSTLGIDDTLTRGPIVFVSARCGTCWVSADRPAQDASGLFANLT
jgi:hypothetical protein